MKECFTVESVAQMIAGMFAHTFAAASTLTGDGRRSELVARHSLGLLVVADRHHWKRRVAVCTRVEQSVASWGILTCRQLAIGPGDSQMSPDK